MRVAAPRPRAEAPVNMEAVGSKNFMSVSTASAHCSFERFDTVQVSMRRVIVVKGALVSDFCPCAGFRLRCVDVRH